MKFDHETARVPAAAPRNGRPPRASENEDARVGDRFQIAVAPDRALDAFYHPFADAA
jgi:hypothetical protein